MIIFSIILLTQDIKVKKYESVKTNAIKFLDSIKQKINPITLRERHNMKGKKHFVEYLNAYLFLYQTAKTDKEKNYYKKKVKEIILPVYKKEYHNLAEIPFKQFKEDIISYLNACRILDIFGFDTKLYKKEINKIIPLIINKEHLNQRGVDNNMTITFCLKELGFTGGYSYCECYQMPGCVLREHPNLCNINWDNPWEKTKIYDLTHEIFSLTNYGTTKIQCANENDIIYAKEIIPKLISMCIEKKDMDILAELIISLHYLGIKNIKEYDAGIDFLLNNQNSDGSWGNYEKVEEYVKEFRPKYLVDVGQYLHTTEVVIGALTLAIGG